MDLKIQLSSVATKILRRFWEGSAKDLFQRVKGYSKLDPRFCRFFEGKQQAIEGVHENLYTIT